MYLNTSQVSISYKKENTTTSQKQTTIVHFVFDVSSSMTGKPIKDALSGAKLVFDSLNKNDYISYVLFSGEVLQRPRLGVKAKQFVTWNKVESDVQGAVGGSTALFDGALASISQIPRNKKYNGCHHEFIVLTDGADNSSAHGSFQNLQNELQTPSVKSFNCSFIGVNISPRFKRVLTDLCAPSHCKYLDCDYSEIVATFNKVKEQIIVRRQRLVIDVVNTDLSVESIMQGLGGMSLGKTTLARPIKYTPSYTMVPVVKTPKRFAVPVYHKYSDK
jgi:Mg-chelatase subunit ChlD